MRGDFTTALIAGLHGHGAAKAFDETRNPPYVVRWTTLSQYLEDTVPRQEPRPRGEGDFVIASFADGSFADVTLNVVPTAVTQGDLSVRVQYHDPHHPADRTVEGSGPPPLRLAVPPRRHRVLGRADDRQGWLFVDAYTDRDVHLDLNRGPEREDSTDMLPVFRNGSHRGVLQFRSADPAAVAQVYSLSGQLIGSLLSGARTLLQERTYLVVRLGRAGRRQSAVDVIADRIVLLDDDMMNVRDGSAGSPPWVGPAALLAAHASNELRPRSGFGALRISGAAGAPPDVFTVHGAGNGHRRFPFRKSAMVAGGWVASADAVPHGRVSFTLDRHHLAVPVRAGVVTAVVLDGSLSVGLFDMAVLADQDRELVLIDRAQHLLAGGFPSAAQLVLDHVDTRVQRHVPSALRSGAELADRVRERDRPYLLTCRPWAILADHPRYSG